MKFTAHTATRTRVIALEEQCVTLTPYAHRIQWFLVFKYF